MAAGKGFCVIGSTTSGLSTTTTSNVGDGYHVCQLLANRIGSTLPATLQSFMLPPITSSQELRLALFALANSVGNNFSGFLARVYKIGTQVLTSTGDQFTHDSATFPITQKKWGIASQPLVLLPMLVVTTATTTTAAVLTMKTAAGGAGYKNQDGSSIVGATSLTFPATATALGTSFILPVNNGDSGVTDIIAIQTVTAASAGAASVWGVAPLCSFSNLGVELNAQDSLFSGISMVDLAPGVATSGTATSALVLFVNTGTTDAFAFVLAGALNV